MPDRFGISMRSRRPMFNSHDLASGRTGWWFVAWAGRLAYGLVFGSLQTAEGRRTQFLTQSRNAKILSGTTSQLPKDWHRNERWIYEVFELNSGDRASAELSSLLKALCLGN